MKRIRKQILALLAALTLVLALAAGCGGGQGDDPQQFHAPASGENAGAVEPEDVPEDIQPENSVPTEEQTQDQEPADTRPEDSASAGGQPEEETKDPVDAPSAEPKTEETVKPEPKPEPEPVSEPEPEPEEAVPEDGNYTVSVTLEGGTGRATVESPAVLRCENGMFYATIVWSSPNYDYMKVGGEKYLQTNTEGNSTFEIPVAVFDQKLDIIADTVAMSEPHEVEYTLYFDSTTLQKQ